jgi:hypothetical protein
MDSWFIKQPKSGEHVSGIGVSSSTEEIYGCPAIKRRRVRKYQTNFLTQVFTYQFVNAAEPR